MNRAGGDVLLVVGDTAVADGDVLEQCLSRFHFAGPNCSSPATTSCGRTATTVTSSSLDDLPRRVRDSGWRWLADRAVRVDGDVAIVGSVGWYDYSFAPAALGIPRRFYEHKVSPGAAERLPRVCATCWIAATTRAAASDVVAALERRQVREAAPQRRARSSASCSTSSGAARRRCGTCSTSSPRFTTCPSASCSRRRATHSGISPRPTSAASAIGANCCWSIRTCGTSSAATATSPPRRRSGTRRGQHRQRLPVKTSVTLDV